jgi:uncharacterized protein (TIGR02118 family)
MPAKLTVLYGHPTNPAAFEKYYAEVHLPLADKITGYTRVELTKGLPGPDGAKPAFYRTAEFWFESPAAMQACFDTPDAKATAADLANFATGGVTLYTSEVVE